MTTTYAEVMFKLKELMESEKSLRGFYGRLRKEVEELMDAPEEVLSCSPVDPSTGFKEWEVKIRGPVNTPYENGVFVLHIKYPPPRDYPFEPPKITMKTKVFHPNISSKGEICLDILHKNNYRPVLGLKSFTLSIVSLLSDPNTDDFLVPEAADLYRNNREKFDSEARKWTRKYAMAVCDPAEAQKNSNELTNNNDTVAIINILSDPVKKLEAIGSQPKTICRSARFSVFEPLKKTFDNGESKVPLKIIEQCFVPEDYHSKPKMTNDRRLNRKTEAMIPIPTMYRVDDLLDVLDKLNLNNELDSMVKALLKEAPRIAKEEKYNRLLDKVLAMALPKEAFTFWQEKKCKSLGDKLLARVLLRERIYYGREEKCKMKVDKLLAKALPTEAFKLDEEVEHEMLGDELLDIILQRVGLELLKQARYEWFVHRLSDMESDIAKSKFWNEEKYERLVPQLLVIGLKTMERGIFNEMEEFKRWEAEKYTRLNQGELLPLRLLIEENQSWEEEKFKMLVDELFKLINTTPEQVTHGCIHLYSKFTLLYRELNKFLREADVTKIRTYGPFVRLLYFYFNHPSSIEVHDIEVYRGMELTPSMIDEYKEAAKHGGSFRWAGFSSTSRSLEVAESWDTNTLFIMKLKKIYRQEKKAIDISGDSQFPQEEEILLKAGIEFTVREVHDHNGKYYISLTVYV